MTILRIGAWRVDQASGQISCGGETVRLEVRAMRLLLCLAERAGEVVSIDELISKVWAGVVVSPDSVYQAMASLRRQLGDDAKQATYIETVPRLGYRMVAKVGPWAEDARPQVAAGRRRAGMLWAGSAAFCVAAAAIFLMHGRIGSRNSSASTVAPAAPQKSIAVLPFLDLTDGMKEEEFADGMTEELIDKLSKVHGLRVPAATSSFYYKDKQLAVSDIARALGVAYVVDGSVRKSATRLRVVARLVQANDGYVMWSETYDRPLNDKLTVQDDIAGEVAKAVGTSIAAGP